MDIIFSLPFLCVAGYLLGSVPFALVLTRLAGYGDIRKIGSGNIGATNVLRTGNKPLAALTLILDSGKGAFIVLAYRAVHPEPGVTHSAPPELFHAQYLLVGLFAIVGHCYPVWLKFKGGKGVAATLGTLLAAVPYTGLAACGIWLIVALLSRISSLAALTAVALSPLVTFFAYGPVSALVTLLIAAIVWLRHRENIKRIAKGEESKIGRKKT